MNTQAIKSCSRVTWQVLITCLFALASNAQETEAAANVSPDAAPAGPVYLFAHAAPSSTEEAVRVLESFEASPAKLLVLTPLAGVDLAGDFGANASKPVLLAGGACTKQPGGCVTSIMQGPDNFLALAEDAGGGRDGDLYLARRLARSSRWSIAAVRHYAPLEEPRLDLVLLRDDAVDVLLVGTSSLLSTAHDAKSPFGPTLVHGPQPPDAGVIRLFEVSDSGVIPHVPEAPNAAEGATTGVQEQTTP